MKAENLMTILKRLAASSAKEPTPDAIDALVESITFNKLTDPEIMRGYHASRDGSQWFPRPSEFLARARPAVSPATVSGEADTIFQNLIDHPTRYGTYSPNTGTIYDRGKVEAAHGRAAGIAFAAVASRFRNLDEDSVPFVRRDFVAAYESARADHGAPLTLDPARLLPSSHGAALALSGGTSAKPQADEEGEGPELRRFRELVLGRGPRAA